MRSKNNWLSEAFGAVVLVCLMLAAVAGGLWVVKSIWQHLP